MAIKLRAVKKSQEEVKKVPVEEPKKRKSHSNRLPSDSYKEEFPPLELEISPEMKLVFSVKRGGEYGLPHVDIRQFVTTERYTGFTKKGINFPLEFLWEFYDKINELNEKCDEAGLE